MPFTVWVSGDKPRVRNLKLQTTCQQMTWSLIVLCGFASDTIIQILSLSKGETDTPLMLTIQHSTLFKVFILFYIKTRRIYSLSLFELLMQHWENRYHVALIMMQCVISSFDLLAWCWQSHLKQSISLTVPPSWPIATRPASNANGCESNVKMHSNFLWYGALFLSLSFTFVWH